MLFVCVRAFTRAQSLERRPVPVAQFQNFRLLGRGGFGEVQACRKTNSGAIYAIKK
jgi:hypothetical protein